jgi:ABC-2 type transport system ATP-binding protein
MYVENAIEVRDLTKIYPATRRQAEKRAVSDLTFSVPKGQVIGLLGPNGAGKTTTIQMLLGLIEPDHGSVMLLGNDVNADRTKAVARTSFCGTYGSFPSSLTTREIIGIYGEIFQVEDVRAATDRVIDLCGIERFANNKLRTMSSGEHTMVSVARALVNEPELLILDEPTANLDPDRAHHVREILISEAARTGMTVLITSHNMRDVEWLCDRVLMMANGRLIADGTTTELQEKYQAEDLDQVFVIVAREVQE